jgi:hypothetical protein
MSDLRDLLARTLAAQGALVEPVHPDGLEICAPPHLQEALGLPEWSRVGFGAVLPEQALRVSFESEWAQRLTRLLGDRGKYVTLDLAGNPPALTASELTHELARALVLENATFRFREAAPAQACYFLLVFRVTSTSDDKREDVLYLCINESNGTLANHLISPLLGLLREESAASDAGPVQTELPLAFSGQRVRELAERLLPGLIRPRLAPFLAGMERRMARDLDRLHSYHGDLRSEVLAKIEDRKRRGADPKTLESDQMRLQAIEREYFSKVGDLNLKYAMSVEIGLMQAARAQLPVLRTDMLLLRRKGIRKLHLDWSGLAKGFDQLPCESCFTVPKTYAVCDDRLHCVCPSCLRACPECAKESCRACHPRKCPRCGRARENVDAHGGSM